MYNIIQGDCLQEMDKLITTGVKVDMILTDPPYGTTQCKWDTTIPFEPMWERIWKIVKPNGAVCLFGSEPFSSLLRSSDLNEFKYDWVWIKNKATGYLNAKKQPLRKNEIISVFYKNQPKYNPQGLKSKKTPTISKGNRGKKGAGSSGECYGYAGKDAVQYYENYPSTIIEFQVDMKAQYHPTQKPVALLEYLIRTYTNEGETVLDFTMGSGSTGVACINTNRNFIGIELDQKYYNIAKSRLEEVK